MSQAYKAGTVNVTAGSKTVRGNGTAWLIALVGGGLFTCQGFSAPIASITTDSELELDIPFVGSTGTAQSYSIFRETSTAADVIEANDRLAEIVQRLRAGSFLQPDATGTLAQRAAYDNEDQGFIYIQTDIEPFLVYIKTANTPAAWSAGTPLVGPEGEPGPSGAGDAYDIAFWDPGRAAAGETVFKIIVSRTVTFPAGLTNSQAIASTAATTEAVWSIRRNGVEFATMTFEPGATVAAFASTADTLAGSGDLITIVAPDSRDATLADITGVLAGTRSHTT